MSKKSFCEIVSDISDDEDSYHRNAYYFLREALDLAVEENQPQDRKTSRHVNAAQLVKAFCELANERFGVMASDVISEWGIKSSSDIGKMVFVLVEKKIFAKTDEDRLDDFAECSAFEEFLGV